MIKCGEKGIESRTCSTLKNTEQDIINTNFYWGNYDYPLVVEGEEKEVLSDYSSNIAVIKLSEDEEIFNNKGCLCGIANYDEINSNEKLCSQDAVPVFEQKENHTSQNFAIPLTAIDEKNETDHVKCDCNTPTAIREPNEEYSHNNNNEKVFSIILKTSKNKYESSNSNINKVEVEYVSDYYKTVDKEGNYEELNSDTPYFTQTKPTENNYENCFDSPVLNEQYTNIPILSHKTQSNVNNIVSSDSIKQYEINESVPCSSSTKPVVKYPKFIFVKNKFSTQRSAPEFYSDSFIKQSDLHNCYFQIIDDPDILDFPLSSISETRVKYPLKTTSDTTERSTPFTEPCPVLQKNMFNPSIARRTHSVSHCLEMTRLSPPSLDPGPSRRHRHSISGQMSYFRMSGYGVIVQHQKRGGSTSSLFSTAVISGSSSAPNLRDMIPNSASVTVAIDGCGGVPPIRPLETLHNALSLRQLDGFLDKMTHSNIFRTPASSPPPKMHSAPLPETIQSPNSSMVWSGPPSFVSSSGPSSPNGLSDYFRGSGTMSDSSDMSASTVSNDGMGLLSTGMGRLNDDENSYYNHSDLYPPRLDCSMLFSSHHGEDSGELTPVSINSEAEQVYRPFLEETTTPRNDIGSDSTVDEDLKSESIICEDEEEEKTLTAFTREECARPRLAEIKWHRDDEEIKVKKFAYGRFECSEATLENQSTLSILETTVSENEDGMEESVEESVKDKKETKSFMNNTSDFPIPSLNMHVKENEGFLAEEIFEMDCEPTETNNLSMDITNSSPEFEGNCCSSMREKSFSEMSNQTDMSCSVSPVITLASSLKDSKSICRGFVVPQTEPKL